MPSIPLLPALALSGSLRLEILARPALSPQDAIAVVETLAQPAWQGRKAGTPEGNLAGDWLAARMEAIGLDPGWEGGYLQPFDLAVGIGERTASLGLEGPEGLAIIALDEGFAPLRFSADGSVEGRVWLGGYGIHAPQEGWDDWADAEGNPVDLEGGIAILFRGFPDLEEDHPLRHPDLRGLRNVNTKIQMAREHGSGAVLFADPLPGQGLKQPPGSFRYGRSPLPAGLVSWEVFARLFPGEGTPEEAALRAPRPPFPSPSTAVFSTLQTVREGTGRNVLGFLEGPPGSPLVVLGAHYDHLGLGEESSMAPSLVGTPHLGADDNASGTALVLEVAHHMASLPPHERPARLLFALFDGEEMGLLGSQHLLAHFPVPLEEVALMVNADMVGRLSGNGALILGGTGTAREWGESLQDIPRPDGLEVLFSADGAGRSDHTAFLTKGIPSLFLFTGAHGDYHKPSDTPDLVDAEGIVRIALYTESLIRYLAPRAPLTFQAPAQTEGSGRGGYGPWFGSIPDFTPHDEEGYWIGGTSPGSPAEQGGLLAGDRIVELDDRRVADIYSFTGILRTLRPGDEVLVRFFRGETMMETVLTLGRRE